MAGDGDGAVALTSGGRGGATAGCSVYGVGPACCGAVECAGVVSCCGMVARGMVAAPFAAPSPAFTPGAAVAAAGFSHTVCRVAALQ